MSYIRGMQQNQHPQSLEAFAAVQPTAQQTRDRIMAYAIAQGLHGLIADEVTAAWRCDANHTAPRISGLKRDGLLVETCRTRLTRAGNSARVLIAKQFTGEADSLFGDLCPDRSYQE